jgi:sigma-E factor negative regulatory protein RseC
MGERIGIVLEIENGGFARIVTNRSGACGGCDSSSEGCHGCLANSRMISLVANPVGAKSGDTVQVEINSKDLFKGAAVLYILPVLTLLAGALAGRGFESALGWSETGSSILGGLLGLAVGFAIVKLVDRSQWARQRLSPRITAVVSPGRESAEPAAQAGASCCR